MNRKKHCGPGAGRPGAVRLMLGLVAVAAIAATVKEMPALRRYLKAESM